MLVYFSLRDSNTISSLKRKSVKEKERQDSRRRRKFPSVWKSFFEYRTNASGTMEVVLQTKAGTGKVPAVPINLLVGTDDLW
mgnify:CR=1 FL=1